MLTVTRKSITITANSSQKSYDGTALEDPGYLMTGTLCQGHRIEVVVKGSQTAVGRSSNVVESVRIFDESGKDVTNNYEIKSNAGLLRVTK